jgi:chromosome segregation ATPase
MKNTVDNQLKTLQDQINTFTSSIQSIESSQHAQTEKMTTPNTDVMTQLTNLETRTGVLESNLTQLKQTQENLVANSAQLGNLVNNLNQTLSSTETRLQDFVTKLDGQMNQMKSDITASEEKSINEYRSLIQNIQQEIPGSDILKEIEFKISNLITEGESLKQKIDAIQKEKETLTVAIEGNVKDIAQLKESVQVISQQEGITTEMGESMQEEINSLLTTKDELQARIAKTDEQITQLSATLKEWEMKWDSVNTLLDNKIADVKQLIEQARTEFQKVKDDLLKEPAEEKLKPTLAMLDTSINELVNRITALEQFKQDLSKKEIEIRVDSIEEKIAGVEGKIEKIVQEYGIAVPEIETLKENLDQLKNEKTQIEDKVNSLFNAIEGQKFIQETQRSVQNLGQEKESLRVEIEQLGDEKSELEAEFRKKQTELNQINQDLALLKEEKKSIEAIQKLEEEKQRVEKEVQNLAQSVQDKLNQIESLQKKVEDLTAQLDESKKYTSYIILPWDNLWTISRRYYRDGTKWKKILEANADVIDSPYNLRPYTEIKIPRINSLN